VKPLRFISLCAIVALPFVLPVAVQAQDSASARNQLISRQCKSVQSTIGALQRRDLVSRTNLGREYESIARELDAFNKRVRNNGINAQPYEQLLSQLNDATTRFREAYVSYDDSLNALLSIDCQNKPGEFDAQLNVARNLRDSTEGATLRAAAIVGQYRDAAAALAAELAAEGRTQ
jgi:hypothetical protein